MDLNEQRIICRVLHTEYEKIRSRNPSFSQRAFAKKVRVHPGTLVGILNGKRKLSSKAALKLISNLNLEKDYSEWLTKILEKKKYEKTLELERSLIDIDRFTIISEPIYLNVLNMLRTKGAKKNISWIAKRLNISVTETQAIINRLIQTELVAHKNGNLIPAKEAIKTPENFPHHAIRSFHKNTMLEAMKAIDDVPIELRDFSAITIPADPTKIEEVRGLIKNFRDQVSFLLGASEGQEVYKLSVQFYPASYKGKQ